MRADKEHAFGNSIESLKDDAKPHQCPENSWEDSELKIPHNEKENACELFRETRGDKLDKENGGNLMGGECLRDVMNGSRKEEHASHFSAKGDSPEKEGSVLYLDKSVTACDLPEIVVCYKENTYHVVKDICVDEDSCKRIPDQSGSENPMKAEVNVDVLTAPVTGILESKSSDISPIQVKVEEDSDLCNDSESGSKSLTTQHIKDATDKTSERAKEVPDVQVSSTGNCADAEESRNCNRENLIATGEFKDDASCAIAKDVPTLDAPEISPKTDPDKHICTHGESESLSASQEVNYTKESLTLADIISMEDGKKPLNHHSGEPREQSSQESSEKRSSESASPAPNLDETEDSETADVLLPVMGFGEASETEKANNGKENSGRGKSDADVMDVSSVSTSQESTTTIGPSKDCHGDSETGQRTNESQRLEPEYYVARQSYGREDCSDHPFSSHFTSGFGETSFSATEPVSGHITYSGPIAFSGSLSVRSDGSTTSTRSFAFPVLQSEWNSSPVRMAKADKRHLRSQKSWRHTLFCCRF